MQMNPVFTVKYPTEYLHNFLSVKALLLALVSYFSIHYFAPGFGHSVMYINILRVRMQ